MEISFGRRTKAHYLLGHSHVTSASDWERGIPKEDKIRKHGSFGWMKLSRGSEKSKIRRRHMNDPSHFFFAEGIVEWKGNGCERAERLKPSAETNMVMCRNSRDEKGSASIRWHQNSLRTRTVHWSLVWAWPKSIYLYGLDNSSLPCKTCLPKFVHTLVTQIRFIPP